MKLLAIFYDSTVRLVLVRPIDVCHDLAHLNNLFELILYFTVNSYGNVGTCLHFVGLHSNIRMS